MDLQTAFYTLGIVFFMVFLVVTVAVGLIAFTVYRKYKEIQRKTKRGVERFKEAMPIVSYFFNALNTRRKKRNR